MLMMMMLKRFSAAVVLLLCSLLALPALAENEVNLSSDEFARLDTFEAHTLQKADKVFGAKEYRRAVAEYDSFTLEFPRSSAIPYALLRRARSLHLDGKRFEAIKSYDELLDYFPNDVKFAAASLYYIGLCHWQNGDIAKAMKAWAEMAEDAEYSKHFLAAGAINKLAENYAKQQQYDKATQYYRQVAVDFRQSNPGAARQAMEQVIPQYIRRKPDEPALRKFYEEVGTFHGNPQKLPEDILADTTYWNYVRSYVKSNGKFTDLQRELKERYYKYWATQMNGRFLGWDDYQIDRINFLRAVDGNTPNWMKRLDEQYEQHQKEGDFGRTVKWIQLYSSHGSKVEEYYNKLQFSKMSNAEIEGLMRTFFDSVRDAKMARNTFEKIKLSEMSDAQKDSLTGYLWGRDYELVERVCQAYEDSDRGKKRWLDHIHWRYWHYGQHRSKENYDAFMEIADQLVNHPDYAQNTLWKRAEIHQVAREFEKAIKIYQLADNPPTNLFRIAECYKALGRLEAAVLQLREIENFFKDQAPQAALIMAHYYRDAGIKDKYIATLRGVLKKYPQSSQSSAAHLELEKLGVKTGGGTDAE